MSLFGKKNPVPSMEHEPAVEAQGRPRSKYGIDEAIQLMRTLPLDQHPDLVVLVVKNTLASMNVSLKDTIRDAAAKQEAVNKRVAELKGSISELEEQIRIKREQVAASETELAELVRVMERLEAAVGAHEPTITPPGVVVRAPAPPNAAAPRPPLPQRSKPPMAPGKLETDREAVELRDSAIEMEPASGVNADKRP
jgi:hypothetical protein